MGVDKGAGRCACLALGLETWGVCYIVIVPTLFALYWSFSLFSALYWSYSFCSPLSIALLSLCPQPVVSSFWTKTASSSRHVYATTTPFALVSRWLDARARCTSHLHATPPQRPSERVGLQAWEERGGGRGSGADCVCSRCPEPTNVAAVLD